jgi:transcriptional regulator of arginine metabolism
VTPRLRQAVIAALIDEGHVTSQGELLRRLRSRRVRVSQATLSRDLREMGVVRGPHGYARPGSVPEAPAPPGPLADRLLRSASLVRERDAFGLHGAAPVRKSRHSPRD